MKKDSFFRLIFTIIFLPVVSQISGYPVYRRLLYKVKDIQKRRMLYSRKLFEDSVQFLRVELFAKPVMAKLG